MIVHRPFPDPGDVEMDAGMVFSSFSAMPAT